MSSKISSFKRPGRKGYRYRYQINFKRYEKYFYGNKEQREHDYKLWIKELEAKHAVRKEDNSITWLSFQNMFLGFIRTEKDKTTGKPIYKSRTVEEYSYNLTDFYNTMHPHYVQDITYPLLAEYRRKLRQRADEKHTNYYGLNKKMGSILRAAKWGMAEGLVPVINVEPLEAPLNTGKVVVHTITPQEVGLLVKYSPLRWRVAIKIGFYAGVRPEEMIHLLTSKIDFNTGITKIWEHGADPKRGITPWAPKRDKRRLVLLPPDVLADIKELGARVYVITSEDGYPYNEKNFSNAFKANLEEVNKQILRHEPNTLPLQCTYKTLRKSCITALMDMGLEEKEASLGLGHADKKTSERHYINADTLAKQQEKEQRARLEKAKAFILKLPAALKK